MNATIVNITLLFVIGLIALFSLVYFSQVRTAQSPCFETSSGLIENWKACY